MKLEEIRNIARSQSIKPGRQTKTALIRSIQTHEGNFDCFATASEGICDQTGCSWRKDCFEAARAVNLQ